MPIPKPCQGSIVASWFISRIPQVCKSSIPLFRTPRLQIAFGCRWLFCSFREQSCNGKYANSTGSLFCKCERGCHQRMDGWERRFRYYGNSNLSSSKKSERLTVRRARRVESLLGPCLDPDGPSLSGSGVE